MTVGSQGFIIPAFNIWTCPATPFHPDIPCSYSINLQDLADTCLGHQSEALIEAAFHKTFHDAIENHLHSHLHALGLDFG